MAQALTGTLNDGTITLDSPEELTGDGQRVRVLVEPLDSATGDLSREEHAQLWNEWVENGPQGPIDD